MVDTEQEYVREYKPRKRDKKGRIMDNYSISPDASEQLMRGDGISGGTVELDTGTASPDGAAMMTTSEIIDFAEGGDSTP